MTIKLVVQIFCQIFDYKFSRKGKSFSQKAKGIGLNGKEEGKPEAGKRENMLLKCICQMQHPSQFVFCLSV